MNLYFAPMACSLASRIAAYEAGAPVGFTQVDTRRKKVADGSDFFAVNPMGQVPALRLDDGSILTENTAVLPYLADRFPASGLMPASGDERARAQQWLGFITTELHKALFVPLLDPHAPGREGYVRSKADLRLGLLQTPRRARVRARSLRRRRCLSRHGAELGAVRRCRPGRLARGAGLSPAHAQAPRRRTCRRRGFALYKAELAKAA